jgi:hypothetical protein
MAKLMNYETGDYVREATQEELAASLAAAEIDGGVGAIKADVDGEQVTCYVVE